MNQVRAHSLRATTRPSVTLHSMQATSTTRQVIVHSIEAATPAPPQQWVAYRAGQWVPGVPHLYLAGTWQPLTE